MEEYESGCECESRLLTMLAEAEDLSAKKARIYSRLLTDAALAEDAEALAERHEQRKSALERLATGGKK